MTGRVDNSAVIDMTHSAQGVGARTHALGRDPQAAALLMSAQALRDALGAQLCLSRGLRLSLEAGAALCLLLDGRTSIEALGEDGFRVAVGRKGKPVQDLYLSDVGQLQAFLAGFVAGVFCGAEPRSEGDAPSNSGSKYDEAAIRE